ncbi:hypothetical protein [Staphylococcus ursi]|uniref:hypothetical protein n=1 Tax=Staphylococcus sp. MI 10-1553 TaxID=1912064 RepID=UPI00193A42DE|nr:hypothetical protein [Staphylococcus sp. MI 10-1553]
MTAASQMTEETTFEVFQGRNTKPSVTGNDEQTPETVTAPKENVQEKPEQVEARVLQQEQSASHSSEAPQQVAEET